ncbi:MAG TPA: molybdopterin oxidoreductase, partial [Bacteroidetes bacterium]|nr:molybdopterin oxidoreductase [Bacteroidota bacterium]
KEFSQRFIKDAFGSCNFYEHTTICEQSHHIAYKYATNKFNNGNWTGGKDHLKPDALNSRFILFFGTGAFEANFGPPPMAEKITEGIVSGRLKIAVVDPRFSKTAAKAKIWAPIQPGTDAALALGMIQWILETKRYDGKFLANANKAAAKADGEFSWSTASWLVKLDKNGIPGKYLRASEIGLGDENTFVAIKKGKQQAVNPYDEKNVAEGDLFVNTTVSGFAVKTSLQLLKESAFANSMPEWAKICGISTEIIAELAKEFTSYGKRAVAEFYRGPVQHTNGYYNAQSLISLNLMVGNPDWKGGLGVGGGHFHESGGKPGNPYDFSKLHPDKLGSFGVALSKEKIKYENTTLFNGYPAKRPFYPFTSNVYQEVLPAARAGYPYPIKALFLHKGTPGLSVPAAQTQLDVLSDLKALPLFIASDIVIGESSMYADYIFPDLSVWERWGTPHVTPDVQTTASKVRQPTVAPMTETVKVFGEKMPICLETVMLAVAEQLNLPGYGTNGLGAGLDLKRVEDFYLRMVANMAFGDKKGDMVPEADRNEMELFLKARQHLPKTVFDLKRWKNIVGTEKWKRVVYVLNRGGRYENFENAYSMNYLKHKFGNIFSIYVEPIGTAKHSLTGKPFSGVAVYEPVKDASGKKVSQNGYNLNLITYKDILGGQSRTLPTDYWLSVFLDENYILMNSRDAGKIGVADDDLVQVVSKSNPTGVWDLKNGRKKPVVGKAKVVEGIRPGTVAVSWHFGHWAYGSQDIILDGKKISGDVRRRKGLCTNVVLLTDPHLKNVCMTDPIGGSASFYDTRVKVIKV